MAANPDNRAPSSTSPGSDHVPESVVNRDARRFNREARWVLPGFTMLVLAVLYMWYLWEPQYLEHEEDLIYNLGLIGGIAMLFQFVYSARKRVRKMRQWGNLKLWFVIHMITGVVAPLIIIIHSRFTIESVNGGVAFFAMLLVVFSGVVGRYLYSQMNFDIAQRRQQLVNLQQGLQRAILAPRSGAAADYISAQLKAFALQAMRKRHNPLEAFIASFVIGIQGSLLYWRLSQSAAVSQGHNRQAMALSSQPAGFSAGESRVLRSYIAALVDLSKYHAFGQLFALWRVAHVPVIYLLLLAGLAHVLAVHMY